MQEFIVYKIPNQSLQLKLGKWIHTNNLDFSGFLVSDAHGQNFWRFSEVQSSDWSALQLPELNALDLKTISEENYLHQCQMLIHEMRKDQIAKVVYSRVKSMAFDAKNFQSVFEALCEQYPNNLTYCLFSEQLGFWMGSTPEILLQGEKNQFTSMALAGTLPSSASDDQWTDKERDEQQYVADYLQEMIEKYGAITQKSERYIHYAGPVKHLRNDFRFDLTLSQKWNFIQDFHPTPAVCGVPKEKARLCYEKYEQHQRSLYTGIIGYSDSASTALFVNLRCMQLFKDSAALYVGGGLTQDSEPLKEWLETERKAETLGQFLQ